MVKVADQVDLAKAVSDLLDIVRGMQSLVAAARADKYPSDAAMAATRNIEAVTLSAGEALFAWKEKVRAAQAATVHTQEIQT